MQLISTFLKDLRLLIRDRGEMASLFLMPLAFIIPIMLAFPENGYDRNPDGKPGLPVANYDVVDGQPGEQAQALLESLAESYSIESQFTTEQIVQREMGGDPACAQPGPACDEAMMRAAVLNDQRSVGVIIPGNLSDAIDAAERVTVTLVYNPARTPVERQLAEGVVKGSTVQLSIENQVFSSEAMFESLLSLAPEEIRAEVRRRVDEAEAESLNPAATSGEPALAVVTVQPARSAADAAPSTAQQTIPGYTVMFVFFLVGTVAASVQLERNAGVLRRLLTTPMHRSSFLGGKTLAGLLIGVLQVGVMFAIGVLAFGLDLGSAPLALLVLTIAVVLSAVCIGLAAAAFHIEKGLNLVVIIAALLAGCAFPSDWLPPFLSILSLALPQTWAMAGYQDLITRGMGFVGVLPEIGMLLLFAAFFFGLAVTRFDMTGDT